MADNEIIIPIILELETQAALGRGTGVAETEGDSGFRFRNPPSLRFGVNQVRKILAATGNENLQQAGQAITQGTKYARLAGRAVGGDISAMVNIGVDLALRAWTEIQNVKRELATLNNESDIARIQAGLLDVQGVTISKSWNSGRYTYTRG